MNLTMHQAAEADVNVRASNFERDGFLVLPRFFAPDRIDAATAAIRRLLQERAGQVVVDNLRNGQRTFWADAEGRQTRAFKFNDLYLLSPEVRDLALGAELAAILATLLGEAPVLCNSLNFERGSGQPRHIDSLYMTPRTPHALLAAWVAFEDVHPGAGPLAYFPGSHRIPLYTFNDGTHHAAAGEMADWFDYIDVQLRLRGLREERFLARKGDVFVWHADLVHGGSPITDPTRTRGSLVCHYFGAADCRERQLDLVPRPPGYWLRRPSQPVPVPPAVFGPARPFPEGSYLGRYPDVRAAVASGRVPTGEYHYRNFGYAEGRGV
jgi:ectoine hydroxylase-related dioxygenase (phytanoyl-CoA dioxygenase family)